MTVRITPFLSATSNPPRYGVGGILPLLGGQSGDRMDLPVGSENHTTAFAEDTIVAIDVTADCFIAIGVAAVADVAKSEPWPSGTTDYRYVRAGERVSAI